jgi:hypothetical protein
MDDLINLVELWDSRPDEEVLRKLLAEPENAEGKAADAILRYRQYLAVSGHNKRIRLLTYVVAALASIQAVYGGINIYIAVKNRSQPTSQTTSAVVSCVSEPQNSPTEGMELLDLKRRVDVLERTKNKNVKQGAP